jgi:hypothetical protein
MADQQEMGGRWCARVGVVVVLALLGAGTAMAQDEDEPSFSVDSADSATPAGQMLQQGLAYYAQENFQAASLLFYRVTTEPGASDGLIYRAEYELGKALYRMRLYYGALFYLDGVASDPAHPYFAHAYRWLLRLARRLPGEPGVMERLSAYADFFPEQIDEKYRDQLAYLIGRYYYSRGMLDDSELFLNFVGPRSRWYGKAQFLLGIGLVQRYMGQEAAYAFGEVIRFVLEQDDRDAETRHLGELAVLSMARTLYSTRDYRGAIAYYNQVPESSRFWLDALFEKSWALFQLEEYNLSLGNLHSLNSPFFDDEFYPEGRILQAVAFFRNCNFPAVRETVEEFRYEYDPVLRQLEQIISGTANDGEYYELVESLRTEQEQDFSPELQRILNTVLDDQTVRDAVAYVEELDRELRAVQSADPNWMNTGLGDTVLTETGLARSVGAGLAGEQARIRIRRARDELRNLVAQSEAILVETDLAEQAVISEQLRGELNLSGAGVTPPPVDDQHMLWNFRGEYWRDELGHYWYAIRSRCGELGI